MILNKGNQIDSVHTTSPESIQEALQRTKQLMQENTYPDKFPNLLTTSTNSAPNTETNQRFFDNASDVIALTKEALQRRYNPSEANHSRNSSVASFSVHEDSLYKKHLIQKHSAEVTELKEQIEDQTIKINRLRYDLKARDSTVEDLKVKISEMYVDLELSQITKKQNQHEIELFKTENNRLSLEYAKFYEQSKLDKEKADQLIRQMKIDLSEREKLIERFREENDSLKRDNVDGKMKSMKEKEDLIKHLEGIEQTIIQREKKNFNAHYEQILIESCQKVKDEEARRFEGEIVELKNKYHRDIEILKQGM